jgi:hypothetical protein
MRSGFDQLLDELVAARDLQLAEAVAHGISVSA